jgi:deoxyadenosine/deoxycytidine kinase
MESTVKAPDLLIYLRSSIPNLVGQIHKRGREYETHFYWVLKSPEWALWGLGWHLRPKKILIIDVDNINFVDNPEDLGIILNKIDAELNGLF